MQFYLAPMEGLTTYIYRQAYNRHFGGITKYFTPFIASKKMSSKEVKEILPENNEGMTLIPQILANRADTFLAIAGKLKEYGYDTVNLNLGCPSGTVTARHRGAGFLAVPDELDKFLSEIYEKCPIKISIKTRIGISELYEWEDILKIYEKYPIDELIIHTRLQKEFYKGIPHKEAFTQAQKCLNVPLCYNGDIDSTNSYKELTDSIDGLSSCMIGRGIIRNPNLINELNDNKELIYNKEKLRAFHDDICSGYTKSMSGDTNTLYKMKELWVHMGQSFTNPEKYLKSIKKAETLSSYEIAVNALFREQELINLR